MNRESPPPASVTEPSPGQEPGRRQSEVRKAFDGSRLLEVVREMAVRVERMDSELAAALDVVSATSRDAAAVRGAHELLRSDAAGLKSEVESLTAAVLELIGRIAALEDTFYDRETLVMSGKED